MDRFSGVCRRKKNRRRAAALFLAAALLFCLFPALTGCGRDTAGPPSAEVAAPDPVASIFLGAEGGEITLCVGETYSGEIMADGEGGNVFKTVSLRSTSPAVAAVWLNNDTHARSTDYTITALAEGSAFVYATSAGGVRSGRILVTITDPSKETTTETTAATAAETTVGTTAETTAAAAPAPAAVGEDGPVAQEYVLNTNTGKFHYPWCASVKQMKQKNKKTVTDTRENIIADGYVPCKNCNP